jgi:hypothetical protein
MFHEKPTRHVGSCSGKLARLDGAPTAAWIGIPATAAAACLHDRETSSQLTRRAAVRCNGSLGA